MFRGINEIASSLQLWGLVEIQHCRLDGKIIPAQNENNRAAYFLDNDPAGNFIVALEISPEDGTLSTPVRTSTADSGLAWLELESQDSVVVSEDV